MSPATSHWVVGIFTTSNQLYDPGQTIQPCYLKLLLCNHLRDSLCQGEFKVHAFKWVSLIEVNEAVQAVKRDLINQIILCLSILLLGFNPAVLHFCFPPNVFQKIPHITIIKCKVLITYCAVPENIYTSPMDGFWYKHPTPPEIISSVASYFPLKISLLRSPPPPQNIQ